MSPEIIYRFLNPWVLVALPLPFFLLAWQLGRQRGQTPSILYSDLSVARGLPRSMRQRLLGIFPWTRTIALCLGIVALARPQFGTIEYNVSSLGVDIALVLDVSGSMQEQDFRPNRLEAAKSAAIDFVRDRRTDRISVILFGEQAAILTPPTLDMRSVEMFIGAIFDGILPNNKTAIGEGLGLALKQLENSTAKSRVVVLLTDGENNAGTLTPAQAAEAARALGVRVYTIGMGGGGVTPRGMGNFFNLPRGGSGFDPTAIIQIAEVTGGRYFHATDEQNLKKIYDEIDRMEKSEIEVDETADYSERFEYFWFPALILLALELLLRAFWLWRLP